MEDCSSSSSSSSSSPPPPPPPPAPAPAPSFSVHSISSLPFAPCFSPTAEEFSYPYSYLHSIRAAVAPYGICKIVPPAGWRPECALDWEHTRFGTKQQRIDQLQHREKKQHQHHTSSSSWQEGSTLPMRRRSGRPRKNKELQEQQQLFILSPSPPAAQHADHSTTSTATTSSTTTTGTGNSEPVFASRSPPPPPPPPLPVSSSVVLLNVDLSDSAAFMSALAAYHESFGRVVPASVYVSDHCPIPVDLHVLYNMIALCDGVDNVAQRIGWSSVLLSCGVPAPQQKHGMHRSLKAVWTRWLAEFWTQRKREERAARGQNIEEETQTTTTAATTTTSNSNGWQNTDRKDSSKRKQEEDASWQAEVRRSKRERKVINMSSEFSFAEVPVDVIVDRCCQCKQPDHLQQKVRCQNCARVFHCFCLCPPLPMSALPTNYTCRDCDDADEFGFDAGGIYTLSSFQQRADAFIREYFQTDDVSSLSARQISEAFWSIVNSADHCHPVSVEYGSDLDTQEIGSVFPASDTCGWNLNHLPRLSSSVLTLLPEAIEGISIPWLYVGMCFSAFCWHNEDHYSYSINYVSEGADKQWYGLSAQHAGAFEQSMCNALPKLFSDTPDLLFHLITMLSPVSQSLCNVPICQLVQHAGEIVVTFPQAYHAGFNHGFNIAESVNFAPIDWLPYGYHCMQRYRFFHRTPVWCTEHVLMNIAESLIEERQNSDKDDSDGQQLPLWERAAWLYPCLSRLRDNEYSQRYQLYASGTIRMQPWNQSQWPVVSVPGCCSSPVSCSVNNEAFSVGQHVRIRSNGYYREGVIVGVVVAGLYRVKNVQNGLVSEVEQAMMRKVESEEDKRSNSWTEHQNVGSSSNSSGNGNNHHNSQNIGNGVQQAAPIGRAPRMSSMLSSFPSSSVLSSPSSSLRCLICQHFVYLSCVQCSCSPDKAACLAHCKELCGCEGKSKYARFRFTLGELDKLCKDIAEIIGVTQVEVVDTNTSFVSPPFTRSSTSPTVVSSSASAAVHSPPSVSVHPFGKNIDAILCESWYVLNRADEYTDAIQQLQRQQQPLRVPTRSCSTGSNNPYECVVSPLFNVSSWREGGEAWLLRNQGLLHLSSPCLTSTELELIMKEAEQYIWGDEQTQPIYRLYKQLTVWQQEVATLSLSVCSLISAAEYRTSVYHELVSWLSSPDQLPTPATRRFWQSETELVSGCLSLSAARSIQERINRCPVMICCQCEKMANRYQSCFLDKYNIEGKVSRRSKTELSHRVSLNWHIAQLTALIQAAEKQENEVIMSAASSTAVSPSTVSVHVKLSILTSSVLSSRYKEMFEQLQREVTDLINTREQTQMSTIQQQGDIQQALKKEILPLIEYLGRVHSLISPHSKQQHNTQMTCTALTDKLMNGALLQSISYCLPAELGPIMKQKLMWVQAAVESLSRQRSADQTSSNSLLSLNQLCVLLSLGTHWVDQSPADSPVSVVSSELIVLLNDVCCCLLSLLRFRCSLAECWLQHCSRLLSKSSCAKLINTQILNNTHTSTECQIRCVCSPILSSSPSCSPSLCFCLNDHSRVDVPSVVDHSKLPSHSSHRRYCVCCVDTLLSSGICEYVDLQEFILLKQAREQVQQWINRVNRSLPAQGKRSSKATADACSVAASPEVTVAFLCGLGAEGEALPFDCHAAALLHSHIGKVMTEQQTAAEVLRVVTGVWQLHERQQHLLTLFPMSPGCCSPANPVLLDAQSSLTALDAIIERFASMRVSAEESRLARRLKKLFNVWVKQQEEEQHSQSQQQNTALQ